MSFTFGLMVIIVMLMSDDEIKIELQSWFGKTEESFINHKPYSGQATEITIYNLGMAD
jgi:hypothetical protein